MKNLDWGKLSFGYSKTDYNVRCYYKEMCIRDSIGTLASFTIAILTGIAVSHLI